MKPSMHFFLLIGLYSLTILTASAQKEASHWFFSPTGSDPVGYMDFNQSPAFKTFFPNIYGPNYASIADPTGRLLFYTDGITFLNSQHQIIKNGKGNYSDSRFPQTSFIIPKPGCENLYYNFITNYINSTDGWSINYSIVDVAGDKGNGMVILNNKILIDHKGDALAVFEGVDGESFWLIATMFTGNDLYAYHITKNGVNHCPVISNINKRIGSGNYNIKASPESKNLVLVTYENENQFLEVYNFNNTTGQFTPKFEHQIYEKENLKIHNSYYNLFEFSPNGKNLFFFEDNIISINPYEKNSKLVKFNLESLDCESFSGSRYEIFSFPPNDVVPIGRMQLSSDGKIYMNKLHDRYISIINSPNSESEFNFTEKAVIFDEVPGIIPFFPAFFFKEKGYIPPHEEDKMCSYVVCAGSPVILDPLHYNENFTYEWTNPETEEIFLGMNPILGVLEDLQVPDTTYFSLEMTDNNGCIFLML